MTRVTINCRIVIFWCLLVVDFAATATWARIEYINYQLGNVLPRQPNKSGFVPKWRLRNTSESRQRVLADMQAGIDGNMPSQTERDDYINAVIEENKRWNTLRWWVANAGVLNYILTIPLLLYFAFNVVYPPQGSLRYRIIGLLAVAGAAVGIFLMFYRDYFGSLGW